MRADVATVAQFMNQIHINARALQTNVQSLPPWAHGIAHIVA